MPQRRAHVIPPAPPIQRRDAPLAPTRPHLLLRHNLLLLRHNLLEESLDGGADLGKIRLRREELPDEFASSRARSFPRVSVFVQRHGVRGDARGIR